MGSQERKRDMLSVIAQVTQRLASDPHIGANLRLQPAFELLGLLHEHRRRIRRVPRGWGCDSRDGAYGRVTERAGIKTITIVELQDPDDGG